MNKDSELIISHLERARERLSIARHNANDKAKDCAGMGTSLLAMHLRGLGILEYLVNDNIEKYQHCLQECATLELSLVHRFESGEPISESFVSILLYQELFTALASSNLELSVRFAHAVGGRKEIEKHHDHPFDRAMGYALKALVLDTADKAERIHTLKFRTQSVKKEANFQGYASVMEAIASKDQQALDSAYPHLLKNHKSHSKAGGTFSNVTDKHLSIWGIGLANLAISRGLTVSIDDPLLPQDLLIKT